MESMDVSSPRSVNRKSQKSMTRPTTPRCAIFRTGNTTLGTACADSGGVTSRLRCAAMRFVGPVAIEPDHAEIDAPIHADHPHVFGDRIIDRVAQSVVDQRHA